MTLEKETDVEQLCKVIYDNGEQYMDGTAAINFAALKIVRYYNYLSRDHLVSFLRSGTLFKQ